MVRYDDLGRYGLFMPEDAEPLLSSGQVAKRLGVSPRAVGRWVAAGQLKPAYVLPGKRYRFRWSEVEAQLRGLPPEGDS